MPSRVVRKRVAEVKGLRTENSKTWVNNDGSLTSEIGLGAVHWKDDDGVWQEFNADIIPSQDPAFDYESDVGPFRLHFAGSTDTSTLVAAEKNGHTFSFSPPEGAASSTGVVSGNTVTYHGIFAGVDLIYEITSRGLKETFRLSGSSAIPSLVFRMRSTAAGSADGSGGAILRDMFGKEQARIAAPYALDAKRRMGKVTMDVKATNNDWVVTLAPDRAWLADPRTNFPVDIDPTIVLQDAVTKDAYVERAYPNENRNVEWLAVYSNLGGNEQHSFMRFDVSSIPANGDLVASRMSLGVYNSSGDETLAARQVLETWEETGVTWNDSPTVASVPVRLSTAPRRSALETTTAWHDWDIQSLVEQWVKDPATNHGLRLNVEVGDHGTVYYSSENFTMTPKLTVTYEMGIGLKPWWPVLSGEASGTDYVVNLATGNLLVRQQSPSAGGRGIEIPIDRMYNSKSDTDSPFGFGWTSSANVRIAEWDTATAILYDGLGTPWPFVLEDGSTTSYVSPTGFRGTLTQDATGYTSSLYNGTTQRFDSSGLFVKATDTNGNTTMATYSSGQLQSITDASGRQTSFTQTSGKVVTVTESEPSRQTGYEYYADGRLKRVTDASNGLPTTTDFAYYQTGDATASVGKLKTITDASGHITTFVYDDQGRASEVWDARSSVAARYKTEIEYDAQGTRVTTVNAGVTYTWDATRWVQADGGLRTDAYYDSALRLQKTHLDPVPGKDAITRYWYDSNNQVIKTEDPKSAPENDPDKWFAQNVYDQYLNVHDATRQIGSIDTTSSYTYETATAAKGLLKTKRDGRWNIWESRYDGMGNLINSIEPAENVGGGIVRATGVESYDAYGNSKEAFEPVGGADNKFRNAGMEVDADSNGVPDGWQFGGTTSQRSSAVETTTAPFGRSVVRLRVNQGYSGYAWINETWSAGANKNYTLSYYYKDNASSITHDTTITFLSSSYGKLGEKVIKPGKTPDWRRASLTFKTPTNTANIKTQLGFTKDTTSSANADVRYDGAQLELGSTVSDFNDVSNPSFEYGSTVAESWVSYSSADGDTYDISTTEAAVGSKSQQIVLTHSTKTGSAYVKNEPALVRVKPNTQYTFEVYYQDDHSPGNWYKFYHYMFLERLRTDGSLIQKDTLKPEQTTEWKKFAYTFKTKADEAKIRIGVGLYLTNTTNVHIQAWYDNVTLYEVGSTKYAYDGRGNYVTSETDTLGNTVNSTYDAFGRPSSQWDSRGTRTDYSYDDLDRLTGVTLDATAGSPYATAYRYDSVGNLTSMIDALGHETTYGYNEINQPTTVTDPSMRTTTTNYDGRGRVKSVESPNHTGVTFSYNSANELISETFNASGQPDTTWHSYSYDLNGRVSVEQVLRDREGQSDLTLYRADYEYEKGSALVQKMENLGYRIRHDYDGNGNVSKLREYDSDMEQTPFRTVTASYDVANRPTTLWDSEAGTARPVSTASYEEDGGVARIEKGNGDTAYYEYDSGGEITNVRNVSASGSVGDYSYTYDANGNPVTFDGDTFTYDLLNRMTAWGHTGTTTSYEYDAVGNIAKKGSVNYSYDAVGQLVSYYNELGQYVQTAFDDNGNMTKHGNSTYSYNPQDRLTSATKDGTEVSYLYDTSGLMVRRYHDGQTQSYHWDGDVLARIDFAPTRDDTTLSFTYDPAGRPLTVNLKTDDDTRTYYYRANARGDVMEIADDQGTRVASYTYDPWGKATSESWTSSGKDIASLNPIRYAGYIFDKTTGLYYLRARWYDPTIARFLTTDPAEQPLEDPGTHNAYAYAGGNPVLRTDPTGLYHDLGGGDNKHERAPSGPSGNNNGGGSNHNGNGGSSNRNGGSGNSGGNSGNHSNSNSGSKSGTKSTPQPVLPRRTAANYTAAVGGGLITVHGAELIQTGWDIAKQPDPTGGALTGGLVLIGMGAVVMGVGGWVTYVFHANANANEPKSRQNSN